MKKPWQKERQHNSLPEVFSSINVPINAVFGKNYWLSLVLMVAVGYMDPGNWATDIAGGAKFGYTFFLWF
jgi:manganese transport protein